LKPETLDYFTAAERQLTNAEKLHALGFYEDAGRNCYLAGMNAARGLLFESGCTITKRHKNLYGALSEALHQYNIHDAELTAFLPTMANLKAIADYETGGDGITVDRAATAISDARKFVRKIMQIPIKGTL
jgi:uncharacterized protein (UPF0332 family)